VPGDREDFDPCSPRVAHSLIRRPEGMPTIGLLVENLQGNLSFFCTK
jgi:hypothetical protein